MKRRAGSIVINQNQEMLLIYRKGKWDFPKGKLEKEERQIWALDIENKRRSSLDLEIFTSFQAMEDYNELKKEEDEMIKINRYTIRVFGLQVLLIN